MEQRLGAPGGTCGGNHPDQAFIRQAVGFAIKKTLAFDRSPAVTDLQLGNPGGETAFMRHSRGAPVQPPAVATNSRALSRYCCARASTRPDSDR